MDGIIIVDGEQVHVIYGLLKEVEGRTCTFFMDKEIEIEATEDELAVIGEIHGIDDEALFAIDVKNKKVVLDGHAKELELDTLVEASEEN